jgi:deoxyribodipyrimidine photo-lyase
MKINIFWFRRDLRLDDNHGLFMALSAPLPVIPVFIFDSNILQKLSDKNDLRITFIYQEIAALKRKLEEKGSSLLVLYGDPEQVMDELTKRHSADAIYANHDYEPYARERDERVRKLLIKKGIAFHTFKDQVIFEKDEAVKENGKPYTVFTPYSKTWQRLFRQENIRHYPSEEYLNKGFRTDPFPVPALESIGFHLIEIEFPVREADSAIIENYHNTRDYPALNGTTRLGIHLRFGTVSIRKLVLIAATLNPVFLNELIWREFYMMILWHFPHVVQQSFRPEYDRIIWRNDEKEFEAWTRGQTGYPIVDAGMRELSHTGYMHNRVRMITASFLCKHLLIDWRWGEAWFAQKLLDYELASNNGGWQWAAGTGCDAAPYFRVFNPLLQTDKFDKDKRYIKKWVLEFNSDQYIKPIVDHKKARELAISVYKKALEK